MHNIRHTLIKSIDFLLISLFVVSLIFSIEIIGADAENPPKLEETIESNELATLLDNDFRVEKLVDGLHVPTTFEFLGDDLLVLQKNDGQVRLIRDGILQAESVLDVEVSNYGERGLLGITSKDSTVYLFFTEAYHDGGLALENRIYAYTWNGEKLVDPILVKTLPGWTTAYNGGAMTVDLDKNVYATTGSQFKFGILQNFLSSESYYCMEENICENNQNVSFLDNISSTFSCINVSFHYYTTNPFGYQSQQPDFSENPWETNPGFILGNIGSCIKTFTHNSFSNGNWEDTGVILKIDPNDDYVAIGIRNSFGITVDPLTGNLWMTENGPDRYDEINLMLEKSNLGWAKHVGPVNEGDVAILPGYEEYTYKNPKFSWELPVGVTALEFADSDMFKKYRNWLFVADTNNGNIYKFRLNSDRDGFVFNEYHLQDNVLNIDSNAKNNLVESMDEILFGTNFGVISDLKFGPDGSLYVVSLLDGTIYKISS